eukprot:tig00021438_g21441.t1
MRDPAALGPLEGCIKEVLRLYPAAGTACARARTPPRPASPPPSLSEALAGALGPLEACMKEVLRMYPAAGTGIVRMAPPGGIELGGYRIPGGRWMEASPWQVPDPAPRGGLRREGPQR